MFKLCLNRHQWKTSKFKFRGVISKTLWRTRTKSLQATQPTEHANSTQRGKEESAPLWQPEHTYWLNDVWELSLALFFPPDFTRRCWYVIRWGFKRWWMYTTFLWCFMMSWMSIYMRVNIPLSVCIDQPSTFLWEVLHFMPFFKFLIHSSYNWDPLDLRYLSTLCYKMKENWICMWLGKFTLECMVMDKIRHFWEFSVLSITSPRKVKDFHTRSVLVF